MPQPIKAPAKRLLDPEKLIRAEGIQHWLTNNLKTVVTVVGIVALVAAAWGIVAFLQHHSEEQAAELYAEAMSAYEAALTPDRQLRVISPETKTMLQGAVTGFQKVHDQYPRTQHAALALFQQANAYAALGQFDDAVSSYERWLATYKGHELAPLVTQRLAYAFWAQGKLEEALVRFDEVANDPDALNSDLASFEKGRVLEQLGKKEEAIEAYTALSKTFNSSPWTSDANARIVALGGTPPGHEPEPPAPSAQPPGEPAEVTPPSTQAQPAQ